MENLQESHTIRTHLRGVKYVATLLIIFTVTISFTVTLIITTGNKDCELIDSEVIIKKACEFNTSECVPLDRLPLTEETYVVVCMQQNNVVALDIRHYIDQKSGPEGIKLNQNQWMYLKSSIHHVDKALLDAKRLV